MRKILFLVIVLLSLSNNQLQSQQPPCFSDYHGLTFRFPILTEYPPLEPSMNFETIIAYLVLDSIAKSSMRNEIIDFLDRQTYNDTIQNISKYYYNVVDYDPIRFEQSTMFNDSAFYTDQMSIQRYFNERITRLSPAGYLDYKLLISHIIAHVKVTDTLSRFTPSASWAKTAAIVTCEVLDTIKGKVLPECKDVSLSPEYSAGKDRNHPGAVQSAFPNPCLQFSYRLEWERGDCYGGGYPMVDSTGTPWIVKDKEYIVFLNFVFICGDTVYDYITLRPIKTHDNIVYSMYPIENGIVYDPDDDFNFGTGLTPEEFKLKLRERIDNIKNYGD